MNAAAKLRMNRVETVGASNGTTIEKNSRAIPQPSIFALSKISAGNREIEPDKRTIEYPNPDQMQYAITPENAVDGLSNDE